MCIVIQNMILYCLAADIEYKYKYNYEYYYFYHCCSCLCVFKMSFVGILCSFTYLCDMLSRLECVVHMLILCYVMLCCVVFTVVCR